MVKLASSIVNAAQAAQRRYGVPASVTLAQYGLESAWGAHMPTGSNNPFGIKAVGKQPFVMTKTREVVQGHSTYILAKFRKFDSIADAFDAHAVLLATKPVYGPAMRCWMAGDYITGVRLMGARYATDPQYANKLMDIITKSGLAMYDAPGASSATVPVPAIAQPDFPAKGARKNVVVMQVQQKLKDLGYSEVGNADGNYGDLTEKAILVFRQDAGLPLNGTIDKKLMVALAKAPKRTMPAARTDATSAEVRAAIPEAKSNWFGKIGAAFGAVGTAIVAAVNWLISSFGDARNAVAPITDFLGQVPAWAWVALLAAGFASVWFMTQRVSKQINTAYQAGARR